MTLPAACRIRKAACASALALFALSAVALGTSGGNPVEYMNPHRSDAEALIAAVPVIKVKGNVATCHGGGGQAGRGGGQGPGPVRELGRNRGAGDLGACERVHIVRCGDTLFRLPRLGQGQLPRLVHASRQVRQQ